MEDAPRGRRDHPRDGSVTSLPVAPTPLIGRDDDIRAVTVLLGSAGVRLLTIVGPAGVGKTRLALAAAQRLRDAGEADPVWVDLSPLSHPDAVVPVIARACGQREDAPSSIARQFARLGRRRRVLLILDNAEHVLAAAAALPTLLEWAPDLRLLVTSREPLHLRWEHRYPLAPLALPDLGVLPPAKDLAAVASVALFLDRARAVLPGFALHGANARAVAELCVRLDGLPLAMELAAGRLSLFDPAAMLARLDALLPQLGTAAADAPHRHRTLAAAIDWSYRLLEDGDQRLLRRCAVFAGNWTLDAAEAIAGEGDAMVLERVARLLEKGLIARPDGGAEPRFRLLGVVRAFALERLVDAGEAESVRRAHAMHYTTFAERAAPQLRAAQQMAWHGRLEDTQDDLRAALHWAAERDADLELRLTGALWRFWRRVNRREGRRWLEHALTRAGEAAPRSIRLGALEGAGILAQWDGDLATAQARHRAHLALAEGLGDERAQGTALVNLGTLALQTERFDDALTYLEAGLARSRAAGDAWGAGRALRFLGSVARRTGALEEARAQLDESLRILTAVGAVRELAMLFWERALLAADQGNELRALRSLAESLRRCLELGDVGLLACGVAVATRLPTKSADPVGMARLLGAVARMSEDIGGLVGPSARREAEQAVAGVQQALTERQFDGAWAAGSALLAREAALEALARLEGSLAAARPRGTGPPGKALLSERERETVRLVAAGYANQEIADTQRIALRTAKHRVSAAMLKLNVHNRAELAAVATERHLA